MISKNKKIIALCLVLVLETGLLTSAENMENMPEDNYVSSGYSVFRGNMVKINNYKNVMNYKYKTESKTNSKTHQLKNLNFSFLYKMNIVEEDHYPQGICFTDDYILVTSYSDCIDALGKILVFDKDTEEYQITLGMDTDNHLGGIAFDGNDIWICNSSKMSVERISYSFLCRIVEQNKGKMIDARNLTDRYRVNNIPSTITFYDDCLWVATHSIWTNSKLITYEYDEEKRGLYATKSYRIPSKVQGITFSDDGEVYVSTSYGRQNSSYIKKYNSVYVMAEDVNNYIERIELPPCSEGIYYYKNDLYILFESAGKKYLEGTDGNGQSLSPLDKILVIYDL